MKKQVLYSELTFDEFVYLLPKLYSDESIEVLMVNISGENKIGCTLSDLQFTIHFKEK